MMPISVEFDIDLRNQGGTIGSRLFGHNIEHTRSCVWQGLSAQLVQNRKFHGKSQRSGVALDWYPIARGKTYFEVDRQTAYTAHFDPNDRRRGNEISSQQVCLWTAGGMAGIGQGGIPLRGNARYEGRVVLLSDKRVPVDVRVVDAGGKAICETTLNVDAGEWQAFEFEFTPDRTTSKARLEIILRHPAVIHVGAVSLMPADSFLGMRRDVVDLLKAMGATVLRWPGGNFAGDYRWQDGLLPIDQRAPLAALTQMETLPHTRGYDCHEIDTDSFVALCREIGAEPYITINLGWDTPEMAAAWVAYCNGPADSEWGRLRAQRGHAEPYGVKLWSLGNEMGYGHMEGPNAASDYAAKGLACARAMKKIDPSIELLGSFMMEGHTDRYLDCLDELAGEVDHWSFHSYTPQMVYGGPASPEQEFARVARMSDDLLEEVRGHRNKMDLRSGGKKIGLSWDEWNVWYAWYRIPGVVEGIHNASMLSMFCREAGELGLTLGCFFEPVNEGAIVVEPFRAYLSAGGQVFPLMKSHAGNTLIDLGPRDPNADVDAVASIDHKTGRFMLTLVNRSPSVEHEAAIGLRDAELSGIAGVLLSAPDFLPGTAFTERRLAVTPTQDGFSVTLPKHSLAGIVGQVSGRR